MPKPSIQMTSPLMRFDSTRGAGQSSSTIPEMLGPSRSGSLALFDERVGGHAAVEDLREAVGRRDLGQAQRRVIAGDETDEARGLRRTMAPRRASI